LNYRSADRGQRRGSAPRAVFERRERILWLSKKGAASRLGAS
jgi:hypothetical protein